MKRMKIRNISVMTPEEARVMKIGELQRFIRLQQYNRDVCTRWLQIFGLKAPESKFEMICRRAGRLMAIIAEKQMELRRLNAEINSIKLELTTSLC